VKTIRRNISLSEELDRFAQADAESGGFSTISAYFQDLLRQRRQTQIDQDLKLLARASAGAPEEEPSEEFFRKVSALQKKFHSSVSK
jgi:Arc/MetJ-type ribon-helix-helix transcriptional regulator